jgi:hypothetical protein
VCNKELEDPTLYTQVCLVRQFINTLSYLSGTIGPNNTDNTRLWDLKAKVIDKKTITEITDE